MTEHETVMSMLAATIKDALRGNVIVQPKRKKKAALRKKTKTVRKIIPRETGRCGICRCILRSGNHEPVCSPHRYYLNCLRERYGEEVEDFNAIAIGKKPGEYAFEGFIKRDGDWEYVRTDVITSNPFQAREEG